MASDHAAWHAQVRREVVTHAVLSRGFLLINALATVVAGYGLLANNSVAVLGAMLIATLLGPITGIALALVDGDARLLQRALIAEAVGGLIALSIGFILGTIHSLPLSAEIIARTRPSLFDLLIAFFGGAAAGVATVNRRLSQNLVGAAIAISLMPPLASSGICLAHGEYQLALGAALMFLVNFVAIQFSLTIVLWIGGFRNALRFRGETGLIVAGSIVSLSLFVALGVIFTLNFIQVAEEQAYEDSVRRLLQQGIRRPYGAVLTDLKVTHHDKDTTVHAVVRTPLSITPQSIATIEDAMPLWRGNRPEIHIQSVLAKETTSQGYAHELDEGDDRTNDAIPPAPVNE